MLQKAQSQLKGGLHCDCKTVNIDSGNLLPCGTVANRVCVAR